MLYNEWNEIVSRHFFNELNSGCQVSLALDSDSLIEIAKNYNSYNSFVDLPEDDFVIAIRQKSNETCYPCMSVFAETDRWWDSYLRIDPPPFVAFLGACVLAA
ncbi:MAG: hypothetical protein NTY22_07025, partial [Proteobacteria bacterium]|nr:hypothetical protein [Pseudomonadota bacterium]